MAAIRPPPERLCDYVVSIGPRDRDLRSFFSQDTESNRVEDMDISTLLQNLAWAPQALHSDFELPQFLAAFSFPDGARLSSTRLGLRYHAFVMTEEDGQRYYGFVVTKYYKVSRNLVSSVNRLLREQGRKSFLKRVFFPVSLCLVSHYPFFVRFGKAMGHFLSTLSPRLKFGDRIVSSLYDYLNIPYPLNPGVKIQIGNGTVEFPCPQVGQLPIADIDIRCLLVSLDCLTIMQLFQFLLSEQQLLFVSQNPFLLPQVTEALLCLLYPFTWPFVYIPLVPRELLDYLQAPFPYVMGTVRSLLSTEQPPHQNTIIVDVDRNAVFVPRALLAEYPDGFPGLPSKYCDRVLRNLMKYSHVAPPVPRSDLTVPGLTASEYVLMYCSDNDEENLLAALMSLSTDPSSENSYLSSLQRSVLGSEFGKYSSLRTNSREFRNSLLDLSNSSNGSGSMDMDSGADDGDFSSSSDEESDDGSRLTDEDLLVELAKSGFHFEEYAVMHEDQLARKQYPSLDSEDSPRLDGSPLPPSVGEVPDRHYSFSFVEKQVGKDKGSSDEQSQSATAIDKSDSMDSAQPLPEDVKNIQPSCLNEHGLIGDSSPRLSECSTDVTFDGPDDSDSDINGDDDCSIDNDSPTRDDPRSKRQTTLRSSRRRAPPQAQNLPFSNSALVSQEDSSNRKEFRKSADDNSETPSLRRSHSDTQRRTFSQFSFSESTEEERRLYENSEAKTDLNGFLGVAQSELVFRSSASGQNASNQSTHFRSLSSEILDGELMKRSDLDTSNDVVSLEANPRSKEKARRTVDESVMSATAALTAFHSEKDITEIRNRTLSISSAGHGGSSDSNSPVLQPVQETQSQTLMNRISVGFSLSSSRVLELLRKNFLRMFGGMFKNYREFLIEPTEENPDPPELFDFDRFLEESGLFDELGFCRMFTRSQMFSCFVHDRISLPVADEFEKLVYSKMERLALQLDIKSSAHKRGWLTKEGSFMHSWKRRFFTLYGLSLTYYREDNIKTKRGELELVVGHTRVIVPRDPIPGQSSPFLFSVITPSRRLNCCAESAFQRISWMRAIYARCMNRAQREKLVARFSPMQSLDFRSVLQRTRDERVLRFNDFTKWVTQQHMRDRVATKRRQKKLDQFETGSSLPRPVSEDFVSSEESSDSDTESGSLSSTAQRPPSSSVSHSDEFVVVL